MSLEAWLTPDQTQLSESQVERTIRLPGSLWYLISGALNLLAEADNWEEFGDATPEDTAQFFADVLDDYAMSSFRNVGMIAAFCRDPAVPAGWLILNGQTVTQEDYPELAAVVPLDWLVGSDIVLPDARDRVLVMSGPTINTGVTGGANTHTLTTNEMPAHTHTTPSVPTPAVAATPGPLSVIAALSNGPTASTGNGQPHNNLPAYLAIRWWIYAGR